MRVDGTNHLAAVQAARAYGMRVQAGRRETTVASIAPTATPARAADTTAIQSKIAGLVAARVSGRTATNSSHTSAVPANEAPLQMYRRAADRIEAATAIEVGRMIDVTG